MLAEGYHCCPQPPEATQPQPNSGPQTVFVQAVDDEVFYGGAKGGGKTFGVLLKAARIAERFGSQARILVLRQTQTELRTVIRESFGVYGGLHAKYTQHDGWRFAHGAIIRFGYLDRHGSGVHQGNQPTHVFCDEIGNLPHEEVLLGMLKEMRSAWGVPVQLILTGNPGGPGEAWLAKRYVRDAMPTQVSSPERMVTICEQPCAVTTRRVSFIPARLEDNPALMLGDPLYEQRLRAALHATPHLYRALRFGEFGQQPSGGLISRTLFRPLDGSFQARRSYWCWDTSFGTSDTSAYSVGVLIADNMQGQIAIQEVVRVRLEYDSLLSHITQCYQRHRSSGIVIEHKASGISLVQSLRNRGHPVIPFKLEQVPGDKMQRLALAVTLLGGKPCLLPDFAPWAPAFIEELTTQPHALYKDQADAWSMGVIFLHQHSSALRDPRPAPSTVEVWNSIV